MKEGTKIKKAERVRVFRRSFSSVPMTYQLTVKPVGTDDVSGTVEVEITQILFRKKNLINPLQINNVIKATLWDTFMDVYIRPDSDVIIEKPQRSISAKPLIVGLIVTVIALVSVLMFLAFLK
ncbi:MAG: hypothetical protein R3E90_00410 [Marinicella sp.]|nr:hypothetical protein [Xanthomonadales bacterium]